MLKTNFYKIHEVLEHKFFPVPQELFLNDKYSKKLNSDSKILYGFLLNRLSLSAKSGWVDKADGSVYQIFTRKEVQELLNISDKPATQAFKQLSNCNLIYEKRQGKGLPNKIYVAKIEHDDTLPTLIRKFNESRNGDSTINDSENVRGTNTDNINTNKVNKPQNCFNNGNTYSKEFLESFYI